MIQISIKNGRDRFWQWDVNQQLVIRGVADTFHVHFEQEGIAEPLPVLPVKQADGSFLAPVPNILLQTAEEVTVYVYHTGTDEQYTKTFKRFYVTPREKPAEYIYTETPLVTWEGMAQQCEGALREATNILTIADTAAENAQNAAETAQDAANAAEGKAVEASEQAALAAKSAEDAANLVRETEGLRDGALHAATSATSDAIDAGKAALRAEAAAEDRAGVIALDAAGATVTLPDSAERPLRALTVDITATQSGSGDPAPDNVRPINGWNGATVTVQKEDGSANTYHTVDFGREVFGGRYDWRTGELTVTHKAKTFDGNSEVNDYESRDGFWLRAEGMKVGLGQAFLCDTLPTQTVFSETGVIFGASNSNIYLVHVYDLFGVSTVEAFKAYLAEHPLTVVYELEKPEVVQLDPYALPSTLYPSTTIFANTGDVALTYAADTKNYIDRRILELIGG